MARKERMEREDFGDWHNRMHCCRGRGGAPLFGVFILIIGLSWFGHDMGWWSFNLPWFPLAVTLLGISMIMGWARRREYM